EGHRPVEPGLRSLDLTNGRDVPGGFRRVDGDRRWIEPATGDWFRVVRAAAAAPWRDVPGRGVPAVLVSVIRDKDFVVLAVEIHAVGIAEKGLASANHPEGPVVALCVLAVDDDLARSFDRDRHLFPGLVDRDPPGLVGNVQHTLRFHIA